FRTVIEEELVLEEARAFRIEQQILSVFEEAHKHGIVHCDLKLENVILTRGSEGEEVRVLDFGIAKAISSSREGAEASETIEGTVVGTIGYMSPEQARGQRVDGRSDLYVAG